VINGQLGYLILLNGFANTGSGQSRTQLDQATVHGPCEPVADVPADLYGTVSVVPGGSGWIAVRIRRLGVESLRARSLDPQVRAPFRGCESGPG